MYSEYIEKVLKEVTDKGYKVAYIGVISSLNYGLETENSDYDMKAIINNSIDDVLLHTYDSRRFNYSFGECEIINLIEEKANIITKTFYDKYITYDLYMDELYYKDVACFEEDSLII